VLSLLDGEAKVWSDEKRVIGQAGDVTQWSLGFNSPFPTADVRAMIEQSRNHEGRSVVRIEVDALHQLCAAAAAAARAPAEVFKVLLRGESLTFERPQDDYPGFVGTVVSSQVFSERPNPEKIGLTPDTISKVLGLCMEPKATYYLSVGGKNDKVVVWGGDKVLVEAILTPSFVPE
jgi:hypothetical protein